MNSYNCKCCGKNKPIVYWDWCKKTGAMRFCYKCSIKLQLVQKDKLPATKICPNCLEIYIDNKKDVCSVCSSWRFRTSTKKESHKAQQELIGGCGRW